MLTLQRHPVSGNPAASREHPPPRQASRPPAVTVERVQEMLREIAFVLHATRVVGRKGGRPPRVRADVIKPEARPLAAG